MKTKIYIVSLFLVTACSPGAEDTHGHGHDHGHDAGHEHVTLQQAQIEAMDMTMDSIHLREMGSFISTNGTLEVPPQNEASVTAVIGANISGVKVLEGDKVQKGQILAYITHPDLIRLQSDYKKSRSTLGFLKAEYERHKELVEKKAIALKDFQSVEAQYLSEQAEFAGLEAQLKLLGMNAEALVEEQLVQQLAVHSPINGYVRSINVKLGQYVSPNFSMFEIVNIEHIHADLMVFEKDMHQVERGQKVIFEVETLKGNPLEASIYAVGKAFEFEPKAIHLHAEIHNKEGLLLPGMYVRGKIITASKNVYALPEEAVVIDRDKYIVFVVNKRDDHWEFDPVEVQLGETIDGWSAIENAEDLKGKLIAYNKAYKLISELKKEEAEHSH